MEISPSKDLTQKTSPRISSITKPGLDLPEVTRHYNRPNLEEHIHDTFPDLPYIDSDYLFDRVQKVSLGFFEHGEDGLILDVASGLGNDAALLSSRGLKVVAMEPVQNMIDFSVEHMQNQSEEVLFLRGYAEEIPLKNRSIPQLLCKGSLDHFVAPEETIKEMQRVLMPGGMAVFSVANFDSLSCRFSKLYSVIRTAIIDHNPPRRPHHELPPDHITRFTYRNTLDMLENYFTIDKIVGVSLLWGAPWWGELLQSIPRWLALFILRCLDAIARTLPTLSDTVVIVVHRK